MTVVKFWKNENQFYIILRSACWDHATNIPLINFSSSRPIAGSAVQIMIVYHYLHYKKPNFWCILAVMNVVSPFYWNLWRSWRTNITFSRVMVMVQRLNEFKMNGAFIIHGQRKYDVWQSWIWLGVEPLKHRYNISSVTNGYFNSTAKVQV